MADSDGGGGGMTGMILGILLCAVLVLGFVAYTGGFGGGGNTAQIEVEAPEVPSPG